MEFNTLCPPRFYAVRRKLALLVSSIDRLAFGFYDSRGVFFLPQEGR